LVERYLEQDSQRALVVLGDFNDYELSETMAVLTTDAGRLENVTAQAPLQQRYTYNFSGISQLLDAILVSPALVPQVAFSTIVHVNADYPSAWAADPDLVFRSSDHDIPLVILDGPQEMGVTPDAGLSPTEAFTETTPDVGYPAQSEVIDTPVQGNLWLLGTVAVAVMAIASLVAALYLRR
jgi:hypothetical protein